MCDKTDTSKVNLACARDMEYDEVGNSDHTDDATACSSKSLDRAGADDGACANPGLKRHRVEGGDDNTDDDNDDSDFPGEGPSFCGYIPQSNGASRHTDEEPGKSGDCMLGVIPSHVTHVMLNLDNMIRNVFRCLPIRSLHNVARVCRKWQEVAEVEKTSRHQVSWTFAEIHRTHNVLSYIANPIHNSYSLPAISLIFVTQDLYDKKLEVPKSNKDGGDYHSGVRIVPKRRRRKTSVMSYMQSILPSGCQICGVVADGVVGTYYNKFHMKEVERGDAISCLNIPKLPHVGVTKFRLIDSDIEALQTARGDLRAVTDMPDDHEAMLTLIFYEDPELSILPVAPTRVIAENKACRVVAGGFVHNILKDNLTYNPLYLENSSTRMQARNLDDEAHDVTGLIFSVPQGSTDVKVASVYFEEDVDTEGELREQMAKLKKCNIPERNTIGFMLACCSRGESHYDKDNIESSVFHQLFPKVPLVGLFGQGEICHNYLPDYNSPESIQEWNDRPFEEVYHSMCSGIVLLHLGDNGGRLFV